MFCHKCGREIPTSSQFCPECGSKVIAPNQNATVNRSERIHQGPQPTEKSAVKSGPIRFTDGICPNCGSHDCKIQVQQNITGSGKNYNAGTGCLGFLLTGPFGLLCGLCGTGSKTSTTHRSVWVCKKCGNQFPTRKDSVSNLTATAGIICSILTSGAIFSIFVAIMALQNESIGGLVTAIILAAITIGIFVFVKNTIKKTYGDGPLKDVLTANGLLTEGEFGSVKFACWLGIVSTAVVLVFAIWIIASV